MIEKLPVIRESLLFLGFVGRRFEPHLARLKRDLRAARMSRTYHNYYARTLLYTVTTFLLVETLLVGISVAFIQITGFTRTEQLLFVSALVLPALLLSYLVYQLRLYLPRYRATERARHAAMSLPNVANFLLALSRAGVSSGKSLQLLSEESRALGTAADEFRYAWRDMRYFRADVVSALRYVASSTRLNALTDFIEGYIRTLTGRGNVEMYLEGQMEEFFDEAKQEQEEFLNTLGVLAEVYVALFVAFPIFAIIILIVMGFTGASGVLNLVRAVVYAVLPLSAVGFLIFLDVIMHSPLAAGGKHIHLDTTDVYDQSLHDVPVTPTLADANEAEERQQLTQHARRQRLAEATRVPLQVLRQNPTYALGLGAVLGFLYFILRTGVGILIPAGGFLPVVSRLQQRITAYLSQGLAGPPSLPTLTFQPWDILAALDNIIVESVIIALLVYTVFYEQRARYLRQIEDQLPDFLKELHHQHRIGMSLNEGLRTIREKGFGRMNTELDRINRDLRLNSKATDALKRSANRVRSPVYTRIVILLSAASQAADRLGPVVDSMSERAELSQRLAQERRTEMSLYVVIIYIAFLVFVGILVILQETFFPQIPTESLSASREFGFGLGGGFDPEPYTLLFYHMSVIQGLLSGFVGGKMSEGDVSSGAKHALVMVTIAYIVFTLVLPVIDIQL